MISPRTRGFHHVTLVSGHAGRTVHFYRDLLGFELVKRTVNFDDPASHHLYFGLDGGMPGTLLTFFEWPQAPAGRWGVGGIHHIALGVSSQGAQLKWKRRLSDAGVGVSGPYDRGYFHSIYFRDPDGQVLEIATSRPGYTIDEPAESLGEAIITPDAARLPDERDEAEIASTTYPEPVPDIEAGMRLTGIHHVTGITGDIDEADTFFRDGLGLDRIKRTVNQDDGTTPHWFWAARDGLTVLPRSAMTHFAWGRSTYASRGGQGQTHHIAFRAPDSEAQLGWREHLRSWGLEVTPVLDRMYFESIYFRAPDGLLCEIATDGPGFSVDEPQDALGQRLCLPPWLESSRSSIEAALSPLPPSPHETDVSPGNEDRDD